jgi:hypothetical protein
VEGIKLKEVICQAGDVQIAATHLRLTLLLKSVLHVRKSVSLWIIHVIFLIADFRELISEYDRKGSAINSK